MTFGFDDLTLSILLSIHYFIRAETYQSVASSNDVEISSFSDFQYEFPVAFRLADFFSVLGISASTDTQSQQAHSPSHYI